MQILRLLFAIYTAPIKHLVYLFVYFCNFSSFLWDDYNAQVEIETKGVQFFGGRWGERIRFILGDAQIDKLNFQNIYFLYSGGSPHLSSHAIKRICQLIHGHLGLSIGIS